MDLIFSSPVLNIACKLTNADQEQGCLHTNGLPKREENPTENEGERDSDQPPSFEAAMNGIDFRGIDRRPINGHQDQENGEVSIQDTTWLENQPPQIAREDESTLIARNITPERSTERPFSVSPKTPRRAGADCHESAKFKTQSVLKPYNGRNRVLKRRQQGSNIMNHWPISPSSPSEEDLMLLLMRRRRKEAESYSSLLHAYDDLIFQNGNLQSIQQASQMELRETREHWHKLVQENHIQVAELRAFKEKYSKLKQLVHDIGGDQVALQEVHTKLRQELADLKRDTYRDTKEAKQVLAKCESAIDDINNINRDVLALRTDSSKLEIIQQQLSSEQSRLREEKLRNQTFARYIERLENSRSSIQEKFSKTHNEILTELTNLTSTIYQQTDTMINKVTVPLTQAADNWQKHVVAQVVSSDQFQTLLTSTHENQKILKEQAENFTGKSNEEFALQSRVTSLNQSVDDMKSELLNVWASGKDTLVVNAELTQTSKALREVQHDKETMQIFISNLLEIHKEACSRSLVCHHTDENVKEARDALNQQITLGHSRQLENSKLRQSLIELQERAADTEKQLSVLQANNELQLVQFNNAPDDDLDLSGCDGKAQLGIHEQEFIQILSKLWSRKKEAIQFESHVMKLEARTVELAEHVKQRTDELVGKVHENVKLNAEKTVLQQQLNRMVVTEQEHVKLRMKMKEFYETQERLNQVYDDHRATTNQLNEAKSKVLELQQRLKEAQQCSDELQAAKKEVNEIRERLLDVTLIREELASLQQNHTKICSEKEQLFQELQFAKREVEETSQLNTELERHREQVRELKTMLENAKTKAAAAEQLQNELSVERDGKKGLAQELETCKAQVQDLRGLEDQKKEKDITIVNLRKRVTELRVTELELRNLREESERKDTELAAMQDHINVLEAEKQPFDLFRHYFAEEETAAFDESMVLSFKSFFHQTQSQQAECNDTGENGEPHSDTEREHADDQEDADVDDCVVVPDSQSQGVQLHGNDFLCSSHSSHRFGDHLHALLDIANMSQTSNEEFLKQSAQGFLAPNDGVHKVNRRPGTSNEEMLLRSSDTGNLGSPPTHMKDKNSKIQVPASSHNPSPMKTRGGSQIRHVTPTPRSSTKTHSPTPHTQPREPPAPNSAVKRRASQDTEAGIKRIRTTNLKNLERKPTKPTPKSTRFAQEDMIYDMPDSAQQDVRTVQNTAPAPGKNKKKTSTTRRSSKDIAYGARFSENA